jgi:hypothetical protein
VRMWEKALDQPERPFSTPTLRHLGTSIGVPRIMGVNAQKFLVRLWEKRSINWAVFFPRLCLIWLDAFMIDALCPESEALDVLRYDAACNPTQYRDQLKVQALVHLVIAVVMLRYHWLHPVPLHDRAQTAYQDLGPPLVRLCAGALGQVIEARRLRPCALVSEVFDELLRVLKLRQFVELFD